MSKMKSCVDCAAQAPAFDTVYTLIRMGWRVSKRETTAGVIMEWRCKECWRKHKSDAAGESSGEPGVAPLSRRRPPPGRG